MERLLYRLSLSEARERFLLKGALLFTVWFDTPHRPTRDADFLDLLALAREGAMDPQNLADAMRATFRSRGTPLPEGLPVGLTRAFGEDEAKRRQWGAFVRRNQLDAPPLEDVIQELAQFVREPLNRSRQQ